MTCHAWGIPATTGSKAKEKGHWLTCEKSTNDPVEKVEGVDLSKCKVIEQSEIEDGLKITFYEQEDGGSLLNLEWEEGTKWDYLNEADFPAAFSRMLGELLGEDEWKELMEGMAVVPVDEWREIEEKLGKETVMEVCGSKQGSSGDDGSGQVG